MFWKRSALALGVSMSLLSAACQAPSAGVTSTSVPSARVVTEDDLTTVDSSLVGALDGFVTHSLVDEERHIHTTWPQIPGAVTLNEDLTSDRDALVEDFKADYPLSTADRVATPELNATWRLVGVSDDIVGVLTDDYLNPGGSSAEYWQSTWYDVDTASVVPNRDLIDDWEGLRERLIEVLDGREGVFTEELEATLDDAHIPVVGFTPAGDLFIGFDELQVGAGSLGRVSVVVSLDSDASMLSATGRRARTSALNPDTPGVEPSSQDEPSSRPKPSSSAARVDCRALKCVAMTYDDGPAAGTEELLDTLASKKATATFFVLGQQVQTYPDITRRIVKDGHEIGVHTWDHKNLTQLAPADVGSQISRTMDEVRTTTGAEPTLLRPPYGATDSTVRGKAKQADVAVALWSIDTEDWRDRDTSVIVRRAVDQARPGSIILMHDIHDTTVAGAGQIIDGLREGGFTLVTVSDLIGTAAPGKTYTSQP